MGECCGGGTDTCAIAYFKGVLTHRTEVGVVTGLTEINIIALIAGVVGKGEVSGTFTGVVVAQLEGIITGQTVVGGVT